MKITVLGAGLVGGPIALDLAENKTFDVTLADLSEKRLEKITKDTDIRPIQIDLSKKNNVISAVLDADLVVNATPGFMGFHVLKTVLEAGKNVVDIAFFPEDPFALDELAQKNQVTAVIDCGVAPGMSNILTGYVYFQMDETLEATTYVGGLPRVREWPYEYKAVFSPIDVIEEYTRPARYIENGKLITKPALSEPELINFEGIGTLEAFNTDGLRTMAKTLSIPNMKEKTLRYPGHIEKMKILRDTGFFSQEEIEVKGQKIRPIDVTSKLLFPMWELKEGEEDITIMRVDVKGRLNGKIYHYCYDLMDVRDIKTGIHSMARTTGYTATAVVHLMVEGKIKEKGIIAPEMLGKNSTNVKFILNYLKKRNVVYREKVEISE